jgi:hypothetical protein
MSMSAIHATPVILGLIFLVNLPFGYWRAGVRKLSRAWFVAIHAPVVLAIGMRLLAGIPFRLATLPLFVLAFFAGQLVGGKVRALFVGAVVVVAALAAAPAPSHAGYTSLSATVDELAKRQSTGMESVLFGDRSLAEPYGYSVAVHPFIGAYATDGVLSGIAASWRTSRLLPWEVGLGAAVLDLDVTTWTFVVSSRSRVWSGGRSAVAVAGALGYQFMTESNDGTFIRFEEVDPTGAAPTEFLIDSFHLFHAMASAVYTTDLWILCPVVDVGWVGTTYRLDGNEWDGTLPPAPGAPASEDGGTSKVTFGLGAALDVPRAVLFGGLKVIDDAALFQATLGFDF